MSKRGIAGASLKEYADAEERLLNIFSPPSTADEANVRNLQTAQSISEFQQNNEIVLEVDPSRDNMLQFISDDSDIHSLLACSEASGFRGFDDKDHDYDNGREAVSEGQTPLIYGLFRNIDKLRACESHRESQTENASARPQAGGSTAYLLTNGNNAQQPHEAEDVIECENNVAQHHGDCVIYDDDDNVVLLTDDHCCEIIVAAQNVHGEHELQRSYMMEMQPSNVQEQMNNGVSYDSDICEVVEYDGQTAHQHHVYLSDAALDQQQQQQHQHQQQQLAQQEQLLDAVEEDPNQMCDTFVDDRPDICEVFDHELEEQDDDCVVDEEESALPLQMNQEHQQSISSTQEQPSQQRIHLQQRKMAASAVPRSSTTEFPVSSTSMPNGSDYDDYDDDLATAEDRSPRAQRKYVPLLKNTLCGDAMDRRLANICQSQPQMTLNEKLANWNCSSSCDAVEDVENFEAVFEQHEAEPAKQTKFSHFFEFLRLNAQKAAQAAKEHSIGVAPSSAGAAPGTPYSSDDAIVQKRPLYRRLLHPTLIQPTELIVLDDDDDDDDDCFEVVGNPSTATLVASEALVKTTQTELHLLNCSETKETSTTDLAHEYNESKQYAPVAEQHQVESTPLQEELDVSRRDEQDEPDDRDTQDEQLVEEQEDTGRTNSPDFQNESQFYEQHEFCNYLGLTELATANAVATAMRELANSAVARRSLRVRTQQQLDRMRSDVRGRRRERHQHQHQQQLQQPEQQTQESQPTESQESEQEEEQEEEQEAEQLEQLQQEQLQQQQLQQQQQQQSHQQQQQMIYQQMNSDCTSKRSDERRGTSLPSAIGDTYAYPTPTLPVPGMGYYYHSQCTEQDDQQGTSVMVTRDYHRMSLEAAFAKVYAAAAPAQNELHECMQNRLRQARETKPSIYIVQALNNSSEPPAIERSVSSDVRANSTEKKSEPPADAKLTRKTGKKLKTFKNRRSTTAASFATATHERDLVTRSTTHMNSKLLRNRKISLLKTYELTDVNGRVKQRLSGGATAPGKRLQTPKVPKKKAKGQAMKTPEVHEIQGHESPIPFPADQPQSSPKGRKTKQAQQDAKAQFNRKRSRAKSLPTALAKEKEEPAVEEMPITKKLNPPPPHLMMDVQGFISDNAMVSPPVYCTSIRHYVNTICNPMETNALDSSPAMASNFFAGQQQHSRNDQSLQAPEGFFDMAATYAQLAKPSLVYPPLSPPPSQRAPHFSRRGRQTAGTVYDNMAKMEKTPQGGFFSMTKATTEIPNPLASKNGKVLYIYFELDQLIVLQEKLVSFWKYSKVFNVLYKEPEEAVSQIRGTQQNTFNPFGLRKASSESDKSEDKPCQRWIPLGGVRRLTNDIEIKSPYDNRLCVHNSTPVYVEMRSHPMDHHKRESNLLSLYVNVYYFCEEELRPKMHSVHLDAVSCEPSEVIYSSIGYSRYFVMAWQQDLIMGKPRAGICKYSLTPTLDTLASIREFKQLRHELKHIECLTEDRLIGYGDTRITIWDHRSGDTLMNYDLGFHLGQNLGVMHFPSFEMDQSSLLVLYQHVKETNKMPELRIIACELSHTTPSHRVLHVHTLPSPHFDSQLVAVNTGEHVILQSPNDGEIWISNADPRQLTYMAPQGNHRFYARQKSHVIKMTPTTLVVDSISNHILKLAAEHQSKVLSSLTGRVKSPMPVPVSM